MKLGMPITYGADFAQTVEVYAAAGVSCLLVSPAAETHEERLAQMSMLRGELWP